MQQIVRRLSILVFVLFFVTESAITLGQPSTAGEATAEHQLHAQPDNTSVWECLLEESENEERLDGRLLLNICWGDTHADSIAMLEPIRTTHIFSYSVSAFTVPHWKRDCCLRT